jgi:hypothetical protein
MLDDVADIEPLRQTSELDIRAEFRAASGASVQDIPARSSPVGGSCLVEAGRDRVTIQCLAPAPRYPLGCKGPPSGTL